MQWLKNIINQTKAKRIEYLEKRYKKKLETYFNEYDGSGFFKGDNAKSDYLNACENYEEAEKAFAKKEVHHFLPILERRYKNGELKIYEVAHLVRDHFNTKHVCDDARAIERYVSLVETISNDLTAEDTDNLSSLEFYLIKGRDYQGSPTAINADQYVRLTLASLQVDLKRILEQDHFYYCDWHDYSGKAEKDTTYEKLKIDDQRIYDALLGTVALLDRPQESLTQFQYLCFVAKILPQSESQVLKKQLEHTLESMLRKVIESDESDNVTKHDIYPIIERLSFARAINLHLDVKSLRLLEADAVCKEEVIYDRREDKDLSYDVQNYYDVVLYQFNKAAGETVDTLYVHKSDYGINEPKENLGKYFWTASDMKRATVVVTDDYQAELKDKIGDLSEGVIASIENQKRPKPIV